MFVTVCYRIARCNATVGTTIQRRRGEFSQGGMVLIAGVGRSASSLTFFKHGIGSSMYASPLPHEGTISSSMTEATKAIASMTHCHCLDALEINLLFKGCSLQRRKCTGALALSKTKHTGLHNHSCSSQKKK